MLTPDARLVLLEQLRAPTGYSFDAGVATTFTLDLTAALVPPLAFAGAALRDRPDPMSALAAVRACTDRFDVFCQVGMVSMPKEPSPLFAYLEQMVHQVAPPPGRLFHPKIWFLRYVSPDLPAQHRLLCLSRNLTNDHSWDIALRLDGEVTSRRAASREPLGALIRSLPGRAVAPLPAARAQRVQQLADEASRLQWELPPHVEEVLFHAFGVPGIRASPDFEGRRHLVVSPFADAGGLDRVTAGRRDAVVVSRAEALDRLPKTWLDGRGPFYLVDTVGAQSQDEEAILLDGLHAKAYVVERGWKSHIFVGSPNATGPAFEGNVEFLVELVGPRSKLGVDVLLDGDDGLGSLLVSYDPVGDLPVPESELEQKRLENLLRALAAKPWTVTVEGASEPYEALVTAEALTVPEDVTASVELITRRSELQPFTSGAPELRFSAVTRVDVTPFLGLRLRGRGGVEVSGVVLAALVNDPEGRLDEVLAAQIDTAEKFLRFLALLLNVGGQHLLQMLAGSQGSSGSLATLGPAPGVFEVVLQALARSPESIEDLDRLVAQMQVTDRGREVLPPGFTDLWAVVLEAHGRLEQSR